MLVTLARPLLAAESGALIDTLDLGGVRYTWRTGLRFSLVPYKYSFFKQLTTRIDLRKPLFRSHLRVEHLLSRR